jgi:7-cyano-7-deazaguanine reductase
MFKDQSIPLKEATIPLIETFENPISNKDSNTIIKIVFPEFTCVCPKTGYPDFASIDLYYLPDKLCIELKSWKLFLNGFRMVGTFHETVTNYIYHRVHMLVKPLWILVVGDFFPRGNVNTTIFEESDPDLRPASSVFAVKKYDQHARSF